jgi:hypothetical protein
MYYICCICYLCHISYGSYICKIAFKTISNNIDNGMVNL